jgi:formylglycine-generating enzyme required for sulfatase activity/tRNA A-37 threonylcarbamoyl transferase component Bud32/DNA-directed RNA polymerase specialized sigma24 family protein
MSPPSQSQASPGLARLVQRARGGSPEQLEEALAACRQCLIEIAREELGSSEDDARHLAEGILDEIREFLPQFADDSDAELREWLRAILLDETYQQRRRDEGARPTPDPSMASTPEPGSLESQATPAGLVNNRTLWRALTKLPPEAFKIIHRRHRLRGSFEEIGHVLGVTTEAARRLYIRALALFAEKLFENTPLQGHCKPIPPLWEDASRKVVDAGPEALRMGPADVEPGLFPYFENILRCIKSIALAWPEVDQAPRTIDPGAVPGGTAHELPEVEGFHVHEKIGGGGQGVVYRAYHTRLECWVALKFLQSAYARDPERLKRLRQEAQIAARLNEHGVLPIRDILEVNETLALVMPYVEGHSLAHIVGQRWKLAIGRELKEKPHAWTNQSEKDYSERLLAFFDKAIDALARLHQEGVLHRDLKPSNMLVDKKDNCWLIDFGLARQTEGGLTTDIGVAKGTHGFMAPEQWEAATDIDERTDIFGIGATIYQALTLEFPYGLASLTADQDPVKLTPKQKKCLPQFLDKVLEKALQPDRAKRYQTTAELREDWQRVRTGKLPIRIEVPRVQRIVHRLRRHGGWVAAAMVLAASVALLASNQGAPAPALRTVHIETAPPGARIALIPISAEDGTPQYDKALQGQGDPQLTLHKVTPGEYLVVVEVKDFGFHEVFRRVPRPGEASPRKLERNKIPLLHLSFEERADKSILLPTIKVLPEAKSRKNAVYFAGGDFTMGANDLLPRPLNPHARHVEPYWLDETEVTVEAYKEAVGYLPDELSDAKIGKNEPIRWVTFDQAVYCAEVLGKRIPDEAEYENAATKAGTRRFPWGNDLSFIKAWPIGPVRKVALYDEIAGVYGLFSNVSEWTTSRNVPYPGMMRIPELDEGARNERIVRGGPVCVAKGDPQPLGRDKDREWDARFRYGDDQNAARPGLGFRCARSDRPHFPPEK